MTRNGYFVWPIGNPCPDFNGDERKGDNLFPARFVALDPKTGTIKWHYQFTPHDLHDWDATETPMLVDMTFQGRRESCFCRATATAFSMSSTGPTESFWPRVPS